MSGQGSTRTEIAAVHGPTHSGSGDQINQFISMIIEAQGRRTSSGLWSTTHLTWLEQRFIEPTGFERASTVLDEKHAVVVKGTGGSGRRTAAMMLLTKGTKSRTRGVRFRELFPTKGENDSDWDAEDLIEPDDRLLLDLTTLDPDTVDLVDRGLLKLRGTVESRKAFLVIVADIEPRIENSAADLECSIAAPSRVEVLARHLEKDGIAEPLGLLLPRPDRLAKLDGRPLKEIARLATLTRAARDSEPSRGAKDWFESAFTALTDDGTSIAERVSGLASAPQRALLFSAAMLSGSTADVADDATDSLLKILDYPTDLSAVLDSPNLVERLKEVGARIDEERNVRFTELAQDTAVVGYYWDAFPDLRPYLVGWMDRVIRHEGLTPKERDVAVGRYTEQSLRTDRAADVDALIKLWTDGKQDTQRLKLFRHAMTLLDAGLAHEKHGQHFRQLIYIWSKQDPPIRTDLAAVLIEACVGQLAESHPEQALVRLHHFARRKGNVGELGLDALARFVEEDDRRLRRLLSRITLANDPPNPDDARVFPRVIDARRLTTDRRRSQPLLDNAQFREQLAIGWRLALSQPASHYRPSLDRWFGTAAIQVGQRSHLLDVLVDASTDFSTASRLEAAARIWAAAMDDDSTTCTPTQRVLFVQRLISELDLRQQSGAQDFTATAYRAQDILKTSPTSETFQ